MPRTIIPFNRDWLFCPDDDPCCAHRAMRPSKLLPVTLPHSNAELPANYFCERETQFVSWYRKQFRLPESLARRRIFVDFDGVMMNAEVFVNGRRQSVHKGGYVPFSVDITGALNHEGMFKYQCDRGRRGVPKSSAPRSPTTRTEARSDTPNPLTPAWARWKTSPGR